MTKEQIESILADTGISFNSKRKAVVAGDTITDAVANQMLSKHGVTIDDLRKAIAEASKQIMQSLPDDLRYGDRFNDIRVRAPAFAKSIKWNKVDEALFEYFSIARSSEGGGFMLLITNKDTQFRCVPMSNNTMANLAEITEACSKMTIKGDQGDIITLYDHIMYRYDVILERALGVYKKRDIREFGEWAVKNGLPSMMLNNFNVIVNQEEKDVELATGQKQTMYRVNAMYFGSEKGGKEFPLDVIAKHFETLAGVPSRLAKIPKLYSNDFSEPALYHIDLDELVQPGPHPTWDKYFKRFRPDEAKVMRAFTWSIFKADNTGRQMLYIYDPDGFSGKSVFEKAITSGLGETLVAALQKDSLNNQFSMSKIWNKRLVVIDDNKNPNFVRSEKIHLVLGSGLADVEAKGKNSFMYKMQCKVIASGNVKLTIDPSANHERTRVIIVEPHVTDDMLKEFAVCDKDGNVKRNKFGRVQLIGDSKFEENLIKEFKAMLADCKADYEELCPNNSSIIISETMEDSIEALSDDTYDIIDDAIDNKFAFDDPEAKITVSEFNVLIDELLWDVRDILPKKVVENIDRNDITQHMMKRCKIEKKPVRVDGYVKKYYVGIRTKVAQSGNNNVVSVEQAKQNLDREHQALFGEQALSQVGEEEVNVV